MRHHTQQAAASLRVATSPFVETAADGEPIIWAANPATGQPTEITIALVQQNFTADQGILTFNTLPAAYVPLLTAAEHVWESIANIDFVTVADNATSRVSAADIRVGVSSLSPMGFIGYTAYSYNGNALFQPDTLLAIDNRAVTALANGDYQFTGFQASVFQDFVHELGHAIGLKHNPNDPTAIMNPLLGNANRLPDAQDVAAVQSLYGVSQHSVAMSATDLAILHQLTG